MWIRCVIGLRNGPSTWPPSWQMSHIILSSSSTTMKSSKTSFSLARKSSSRSFSVVAVEFRDPERPGDRVHPYVALTHRDVPLRAGADEEALAGEEAEGPVGAALALHQAPQHRQRLRGVPVGDDGAVVAADDEVGPLTLADLVADDRLDDLAVVLVAGGEPTAVGELDRRVGQRREQVVDRHLVLGLDVDDRQRGAVVDGGEAALVHLPERHGDQPVRAPARLRGTALERDVEQARDLVRRAADQARRRRRLAPDDRPRTVPLDLLQEVCGRLGSGSCSSTL